MLSNTRETGPSGPSSLSSFLAPPEFPDPPLPPPPTGFAVRVPPPALGRVPPPRRATRRARARVDGVVAPPERLPVAPGLRPPALAFGDAEPDEPEPPPLLPVPPPLLLPPDPPDPPDGCELPPSRPVTPLTTPLPVFVTSWTGPPTGSGNAGGWGIGPGSAGADGWPTFGTVTAAPPTFTAAAESGPPTETDTSSPRPSCTCT